MTTPERPEKEPFELHVQRLVTEGKLTPEEAAELLAPAHPEPRSVSAAQPGMQGVQLAKSAPAPSGDTPPDLRLDVAGYALQVLHDASLTEPRLTATHDASSACAPRRTAGPSISAAHPPPRLSPTAQ